jgi:hypothetical protein
VNAASPAKNGSSSPASSHTGWLVNAPGSARGGDHVVAREVLGAIEGPGRSLTRGLPQRRGVPTDRAEAAGMVQRQVIGAEAAHRDAAYRHPPWVGVEAVGHLVDHFVDHVLIPLTVGAVVPVGIASAVGEGDKWRPVAELGQRRVHLVDQGRVLVAVATVKEDEHGPLSVVLGSLGNNNGYLELLADSLALDRDLGGLSTVLVRPDEIANGANREPGDERRCERGGGEDEAPSPENVSCAGSPVPVTGSQHKSSLSGSYWANRLRGGNRWSLLLV